MSCPDEDESMVKSWMDRSSVDSSWHDESPFLGDTLGMYPVENQHKSSSPAGISYEEQNKYKD